MILRIFILCSSTIQIQKEGNILEIICSFIIAYKLDNYIAKTLNFNMLLTKLEIYLFLNTAVWENEYILRLSLLWLLFYKIPFGSQMQHLYPNTFILYGLIQQKKFNQVKSHKLNNKQINTQNKIFSIGNMLRWIRGFITILLQWVKTLLKDFKKGALIISLFSIIPASDKLLVSKKVWLE